MTEATEIRVSNILRFDGALCKVIATETRGTGKFGKTVHLKLKRLLDGKFVEKSLRAEEQAEDVSVQRSKLTYLYKDGDQFVFMDNQSYEQHSLPAAALGKQETFLKENMEIDALTSEGKLLTVEFPKFADLKVTNTASMGKARDNTFKEAELENGLQVLIPPFVDQGETVRINTETLEYMERVVVKSMK